MVKVLFDTSVLVAAFVKVHPQHQPCASWWQKVQNGKIKGIISTHTLAELYSVLTRLPISPRISPTLAQQLIEQNLKDFDIIPLTPEDYKNVIKQMVNLKLIGGAIFDALIAQVAVKTNSDYLLTNNPNHFTRISMEIASKVILPQSEDSN
jgi:predicted nucleic acid-binding protein